VADDILRPRNSSWYINTKIFGEVIEKKI
jgi:hypothetical protein